ncbi:MAG: hypothetical protein P1V36_06610 [Planctomycetota bacterium]|nr:hypothetical protein [Planctomycetota bacterium]
MTLTDEQTTGEIQPADEQTTERPEWLPPKFKTPEDLAKSYTELEKKLGAPKDDISIERDAPTEAVPETEDALNNAGIAFEDVYAAVATDGKPTEKQYKALAKQGLSANAVDRMVRAEVAIRTSIAGTVTSAVGGEEQYAELQQWAASEESGLSDAELDRFNAAVVGPQATPESAKEQVEYLLWKRERAGGAAPAPEPEKPGLITGRPAAGGVGGFGSFEEKRQAAVDVQKGKMPVAEYNRRFALTSPDYLKPPRRP